MKIKPLTLLILVFLLVSCQNKFKTEDQLWECMVSEYNKLDIDIEEELNVYEQYLVDENYLESRSGGSYIRLFEGFIEIGEIVPPLHNERYFNALQEYMNKGYMTECIDSTLFKQTRNYEMQQRTLEVLQTTGDIDPSLLSKTVLSVFSEEDMSHPLNRYSILGYFQIFLDTDIGISRQLPPIEDPDAPILSERNRIDIELNDKDELFFEGKPIVLKDLRSTLIRYLKGSKTNDEYPEIKSYENPDFGDVFSSEAVVSVKNDRQTSYKMFIEVQNEIVAAYTFLRNEKAKQHYGTEFELLSEEQQKKIKEIVPMKLSEAVTD